MCSTKKRKKSSKTLATIYWKQKNWRLSEKVIRFFLVLDREVLTSGKLKTRSFFYDGNLPTKQLVKVSSLFYNMCVCLEARRSSDYLSQPKFYICVNKKRWKSFLHWSNDPTFHCSKNNAGGHHFFCCGLLLRIGIFTDIGTFYVGLIHWKLQKVQWVYYIKMPPKQFKLTDFWKMMSQKNSQR